MFHSCPWLMGGNIGVKYISHLKGEIQKEQELAYPNKKVLLPYNIYPLNISSIQAPILFFIRHLKQS
jgi:hypothetical protein